MRADGFAWNVPPNDNGSGDAVTTQKRRKAAKKTQAQSTKPKPEAVADGDGAPAPVETPSTAKAVQEEDFPIVGIGASAGGLASFEAFFVAMPAETEPGMAFVLVQHLSPDHVSLLAELVRRYTTMPVSEVTDGVEVKPNQVYIIPPNTDLELQDGSLRLTAPSARRGLRLPIDRFFRSLAREKRERAIGLVLSGTGMDGTLGVRAIKGEGGLTMAQTPETAAHDGMPRSAIATGMVDVVAAPSEMPHALTTYVRHAFQRPRAAGSPPRDEDSVRKVCVLLRAHTGHDFSQYKATTLVRRMERRMAIHQLESLTQYVRYLRENVTEVDALFRDLLIGVTNFFRDPEAFKVLEDTVIPRLFALKAAHDPVRVWVCGCSTGEEAYSIAILLQEQLELLKRPFKVQVFATDIDRHAIDAARSGTFPASITADVSPERLERWFHHDAERGTYRVQKVIRDLLVFSEQDVIKDPPFSRLDLISCRNLLIYLNGELQKRLLPLFHYSLSPGGHLFLGTSETVGEYGRLFSVVDRKWKIYQRVPSDVAYVRPSMGDYVAPSYDRTERPHAPLAPDVSEYLGSLRQLTEQALLSHYVVAGLLINHRGDILHIIGRTGKYLEPTSGDAAMNILGMARDGLRRELTTALHRAVAHKQPVDQRGLRVKSDGGLVTVHLTVRPILSDGGAPSDLFLVILEEESQHGPAPAPTVAVDNPDGRIAELERELRVKEDYLQTTLEEMETTNEELKSTNEEMQSVNEELQSTNEELETSKEELQSLNEELSTVNAELQDKVADLSRANNDMNNLLAGTGVGTLFVDHQLRIARFTPAATQVINLIPADVGRPVEHVVPNFVGYDRLVEDTRQVLDTLVPIEAEVQIKSGAWYLMRIRPYRTIENVIEGVVLTLVDISERKRADQALRESESRLEAALSASNVRSHAELDALTRMLSLSSVAARDGRTRVESEVLAIARLVTGSAGEMLHLFASSNAPETVAHRDVSPGSLGAWRDAWLADRPAGAALRRGDHVRSLADPAQRNALLGVRGNPGEPGVVAFDATPLFDVQRHLIGVITVLFSSARSLDERATQLLDILARLTADVIVPRPPST